MEQARQDTIGRPSKRSTAAACAELYRANGECLSAIVTPRAIISLETQSQALCAQIQLASAERIDSGLKLLAVVDHHGES